MKVKEAIRELKRFNQDMEITIRNIDASYHEPIFLSREVVIGTPTAQEINNGDYEVMDACQIILGKVRIFK